MQSKGMDTRTAATPEAAPAVKSQACHDLTSKPLRASEHGFWTQHSPFSHSDTSSPLHFNVASYGAAPALSIHIDSTH
eukprot:1149741-Pelagomonas_calceolata.AAC.5